MSSVQLEFGNWDYAIMIGTMVLSVCIGLYFRFSGGRQKTNDEYLHGGRNMSIFPTAVSLVASFLSSVTILGLCAECYGNGTQFIAINFSYWLATPIITYFYLPVFYNLNKTSTYEYLGLRFGNRIRMLASLTYTLQMILYNGIVLYAPAIVLEAVSGISRTWSILIMGIVCTVYSTLGGVKAVVWTDLLQTFIMYAAILSIVVFASIHVGGPGEIFRIAYKESRIQFNNFNIDPTERHSWWSVVIGGFFIYLSLYAVNHTQVQRMQTLSSLRRAEITTWISVPVLNVISLTTCLSGIAIFAAYKDCDPFTSKQISAMDQIMPYFVMDSMRRIPGLGGIFLAGIMSAALSTVSAACNALAAVTLSDYLKRFFAPSATIAKILAFFYGVVFLAVAYLAQYMGGVLQAALTIFGAVGGPLLGVFSLGIFTTFVNEIGAIIGLLLSMSFTLWISFGTPRPPVKHLHLSTEMCQVNATLTSTGADTHFFYLYRISYMYTSVIGFLIVVIVGSIVSTIVKTKQPWHNKTSDGQPDPDLFTPVLANYLRKRSETREHALK